MHIKKFLNRILDLIYPRKCYLCNKIVLKFDEFLCETCNKNLEISTRIRYLDTEKTIICISPFEYSGNIRKSIIRFKFYNYKYYSNFFAEIIARELYKFNIKKFDYICYVPLTKKSKNARGYDQSEALAKDISAIINIPCAKVLKKIRDTKPQHELKLSERKINVLGAFDINSNINIKNKRILLCDDIITSGTTLSECVKVLLEHDVLQVYCCTIASTKILF